MSDRYALEVDTATWFRALGLEFGLGLDRRSSHAVLTGITNDALTGPSHDRYGTASRWRGSDVLFTRHTVGSREAARDRRRYR